jgi:hypothetical protein
MRGAEVLGQRGQRGGVQMSSLRPRWPRSPRSAAKTPSSEPGGRSPGPRATRQPGRGRSWRPGPPRRGSTRDRAGNSGKAGRCSDDCEGTRRLDSKARAKILSDCGSRTEVRLYIDHHLSELPPSTTQLLFGTRWTAAISPVLFLSKMVFRGWHSIRPTNGALLSSTARRTRT